ncbi:HAD-IA family hydrolase [Actibacterium ureilyticum]|uniref:HAD-IA family hydrolase n=1 Tax=Actibacterium ureilyticum TaxID=1590614 RepID=UPI000BAB1F4B|nr:HAD-IA family hydrolase [Actibacterium ureilyticum]
MTTVFLDLDGTLTDPRAGIAACINHALERLGLPTRAPDSLDWAIGPALIDSFARLGAPDPQAALVLYRERYSTVGLLENTPYDGIETALAALRDAGRTLHLATAKPHVYARRITAHFGLDRFLDQQFGPELDGTRNDKGALLAHALQQLGLDAADCLMVGDRHHDIDAARAVGMRCIGVDWGYGPPTELDQADARCARVADLPDIVAKLAPFPG